MSKPTKTVSLSLVTVGIGFLLVAVLAATAMLFGLNKNKAAFERFLSEIEKTQLKISNAYNLNISGYKRGYVQYQMILTEDPFERDALNEEYHRYGYEVGLFRNELQQLATSADEKTILDEQLQMILTNADIQERVMDALAAEDLELAGRIRQEAYAAGHFSTLLKNMDAMVKLQKAKESTLVDNIRESFLATQRTAAWQLSGVVLLIAAIALYVLRKLQAKEREIQQALATLDESNALHRHRSLHDHLTGLPNRSHLYAQAAEAVRLQAEQADEGLFVLFFDLDGFKAVNDRLGHEAGDELLRQIADRLTENISDKAFLARIGGDEFVALAHMDQAACTALAERLVALLSTPFTLVAGTVNTGTSIGISVYGKDGEDADTLVRKADTAMYVAKRDGGNRHHFAEPEDVEANAQSSSSRSSHR